MVDFKLLFLNLFEASSKGLSKDYYDIKTAKKRRLSVSATSSQPSKYWQTKFNLNRINSNKFLI